MSDHRDDKDKADLMAVLMAAAAKLGRRQPLDLEQMKRLSANIAAETMIGAEFDPEVALTVVLKAALILSGQERESVRKASCTPETLAEIDAIWMQSFQSINLPDTDKAAGEDGK